jgi:hypothetical protein
MIGHSQGTSLQPPPQGSTKLHLKGTPGIPASSYPIKGQAGALQRTPGNGQRNTSHPPIIEDQHLKQSPLYSQLFSETWARFPLSQLVTPTQALRCKKIQYSPLSAGRRAFFCPNQDKPPCTLLASPSRLGTRSIWFTRWLRTPAGPNADNRDPNISSFSSVFTILRSPYSITQ